MLESDFALIGCAVHVCSYGGDCVANWWSCKRLADELLGCSVLLILYWSCCDNKTSVECVSVEMCIYRLLFCFLVSFLGVMCWKTQ